MNFAPEVRRSHYARLYSGFYQKYCHGRGADVGYMGGSQDNQPIPNATGFDLTTPGYDGLTLPYDDGELDFVFSSHTIEHLDFPRTHIQEWFRATKVGGYIIICAPHMYLYEKKSTLPSNFNGDHKHFFTPAILIDLVERSLAPNSYRIELLRDNDTQYTYEVPPEIHCGGACEIELVIKKIKPPTWDIK